MGPDARVGKLAMRGMMAIWMWFGYVLGSPAWRQDLRWLLGSGLGAVGLTFLVSWYGREIAEVNLSRIHYIVAAAAFVVGLISGLLIS